MSTIVNLLRDDRLTLLHSLSKMNWDSLNYEAHMKTHKIGQFQKKNPQPTILWSKHITQFAVGQTCT